MLKKEIDKISGKINILKLFLWVMVAFIVLFNGCSKDAPLEEPPQFLSGESPLFPNEEVEPFVKNELIVKFKTGFSESAKNGSFQSIEATEIEHIVTKTMEDIGDREGVFLMHTPLEVLQAIDIIRKNSNIEYAEPNYIYTHTAYPNDTYFSNGSLWGMYGDKVMPVNQYGSQADEAWTKGHTGSSNVFVGVIDEGIMNKHGDLSANCWVNPFDPMDGKDNDGNGYIDDKFGWDFYSNNNSIYDGIQDDHGTHVSGTIGAIGNNGKGVAGICWKIKIISCKFLGKWGGTTTNAIKAIDYITDLKNRHKLNIVATNNSWGGGGFSQSLKNAIDRANAKQILFIAAAGNNASNNDGIPLYPASYSSSNIIAVASITSSGALSYFSNYSATKVDLGAPGSGIYSCLPGLNNTSAYGSYSGTSMATPHVTGAVALYATTHFGSSAATIKSAILNNTIRTSSLAGKCVTGGRLNLSPF